MSFKDERKLPQAFIGTASKRPLRALGASCPGVNAALEAGGMTTMPSREPLDQRVIGWKLGGYALTFDIYF